MIEADTLLVLIGDFCRVSEALVWLAHQEKRWLTPKTLRNNWHPVSWIASKKTNRWGKYVILPMKIGGGSPVALRAKYP